ncbi:hypothetical protein GKZ89_03190 [Bacillus mangrovi]|uniref:Competence protein ComG n=1 Tax=Metabacillus mangrovi TaxID=1491830 RepID=A0A7X2S2B3_9BACI|nr:competence type IV pilus minor pilin ComGG [Metabacillus mangrovi]MTH52398.1 hypothetical protein [Metabacillus mangrovi]
MKNEKGFIYPFTVMIILLLLMTSIHLTNMLAAEKKFYEDTKRFYLLQHLLYTGAKHSLAMAGTGADGGSHLKDRFGTISWTIAPLTEERKRVTLQLTYGNGTIYHASYEYDLRLRQASDWNEW